MAMVSGINPYSWHPWLPQPHSRIRAPPIHSPVHRGRIVEGERVQAVPAQHVVDHGVLVLVTDAIHVFVEHFAGRR